MFEAAVIERPSTVEAVHEAHQQRVRDALISRGLDPDVRTDFFKISPADWFGLQDQMRLDFVHLKGDTEPGMGRPKRRPDVGGTLAKFFRENAGMAATSDQIATATGLSRNAVYTWLKANPGSSVSLGRNVYEMRDIAADRDAAKANLKATPREVADMVAAVTA